MVDHSPQDVMSDTEQQYSERSDDESDDDGEESSEEREEAESSPSYEAPKEPRSKVLHDPKGEAGETQQATASGQATRSSKRARAEAESSAE